MNNYVENRLNCSISKKALDSEECFNSFIERFRFEQWTLDGVDFVVSFPRSFARANDFQKILDTAKSTLKMNCCFYLKSSYSVKENELLSQHIPFIIEDRLIYLPFMYTCIEETAHKFVENQSKREYEPINKLGMRAQQILCYALTLGRGVYPITYLTKTLNIPHTSFARAFDQIERLYLNITKYDNQRKFIDLSDLDEKDLLNLISKFQSPIVRQFFTNKFVSELPLASFSAMAYLDKEFKYNRYNISAILKEDNNPLIQGQIRQNNLPYNLQKFDKQNIIQEMEYIVPFADNKCIDPFTIISTLKGRELDVPQIKESVLRLIHKYFFKN